MELRPTQSGLRFYELVALFREDVRAGTTDDPIREQRYVSGIAVDSRRIQSGDMFAALAGVNVHGATFAQDALDAGAVAFLTDAEGVSIIADLTGNDTASILVLDDPRSALGLVAAQVYGRPGDDLLLLGVTGTNGKTTTTWMLEHALRAAGHTTGLIGTVETQIAGEVVESVRTTPEAPELHALLALMRERNVTAVAIEVSSHAMTMGRVDGCVFDAVGFTQFGIDHLDFHGSEAAYFSAKRRLFDRKYSNNAIVCTDSEGGKRILQEIVAANDRVDPDHALPVIAVSTELPPDPGGRVAEWKVVARKRRVSGGYDFDVDTPTGSTTGTVSVPGDFNIANALVAAAMLDTVGDAWGGERRRPFDWLRDFRGVPGRMESVDVGQPFAAIVDYAHTPDAVTAVLVSLRRETSGRLMIAFGCGGDRDPGKRRTMGEAAATLADVVVISDDNPRSEEPAFIRAQVLHGARDAARVSGAEVTEVAGRESAIQLLVASAQPGDIIVVAGKGHEQGQEIGGQVTPFDDRAVLSAALSAAMASPQGGRN